VSRASDVTAFGLEECAMKTCDHFSYALFADDERNFVPQLSRHYRRDAYVSEHPGNLRGYFGRMAQSFPYQANDGAIFFNVHRIDLL
jgi:hypothetical protein